MARSQPNSFDRVFARGPEAGPAATQKVREQDEGVPSVHELFNAHMRGSLDLQDFAEQLFNIGIPLTPAAARLIESVDATSGQLSFKLFSQALADDSMAFGGAGLPMIIKDQASAIITDNSGSAAPRKAPSESNAARPSTDISLDPFIKQQVRIERAQANKPAFSGNPIKQTNNTSAGNPFAGPSYRSPAGNHHGNNEEDANGSREMVNSATRMFVSGDVSRQDYEHLLMKCGVNLGAESELRRVICAHEKSGDSNFSQFMRVVHRELAVAEANGA